MLPRHSETGRTKWFAQLLALLLAAPLLAIGAGGCGSSRHQSEGANAGVNTRQASTTLDSSESALGYTRVDADKDNDISASPYDDTNNNEVLHYGRPAAATDRRAIALLVKRYYAAAAAGDGAKACRMLYVTLAETVPEDYGTSPPGPAYMQGSTCSQVMTLLFKHMHDQLATEARTVKVTEVRLVNHHGLALLSFGRWPERKLLITSEGRGWKLTSLLDMELP